MKVNVNRIKELCKERGISVSFVCEKVGQGAYYLNDVKRRGGNIPEERMNIIANILDTSPEYLRDETDDPTPKQKEAPENGGIDYSNLSPEHIEFMRTVSELSVDELRNLKQIIDFVKSQRQ